MDLVVREVARKCEHVAGVSRRVEDSFAQPPAELRFASLPAGVGVVARRVFWHSLLSVEVQLDAVRY